MRDTKVIKIGKKYDKEEVYQAVLTYMSPTSERERVTTEIGDNSYIVKTEWLQSPKRGIWIPGRTTKLTFSENSCYVDIEYEFDTKDRQVAAAGIAVSGAVSIVALPLGLVGLGGSAVAAVAGSKAGFNKFRQNIYKLVEEYLCREVRQNINVIEQKCQCGATLQEGAKFCSECGKKVEEPSKQSEEIVCECGTVLPKGTKFCPMCGKGTAS